jgi:predicted nucleic acid-binding protein
MSKKAKKRHDGSPAPAAQKEPAVLNEPTYRDVWRFPAKAAAVAMVVVALVFGATTCNDQRNQRAQRRLERTERLAARVSSDPVVQREVADTLLRRGSDEGVSTVLESIRAAHEVVEPTPVGWPRSKGQAETLYRELAAELPSSVPLPTTAGDSSRIQETVRLSATPFAPSSGAPATAGAPRPAPNGEVGQEIVVGQVSGGVWRDVNGDVYCGGVCRPELGQICCEVTVAQGKDPVRPDSAGSGGEPAAVSPRR